MLHSRVLGDKLPQEPGRGSQFSHPRRHIFLALLWLLSGSGATEGAGVLCNVWPWVWRNPQAHTAWHYHQPIRIGYGIYPLKEESAVTKGASSICFACLCVAWVYVVTVWRAKPRHNGACVFESHLLLSRFCPVLYIHWAAAVIYAAGCVVILMYHYVQIHVSVPEVVSLNIPVSPPIIPAVVTEMNTIEEDDEDLEAYFRSACQSRQ